MRKSTAVESTVRWAIPEMRMASSSTTPNAMTMHPRCRQRAGFATVLTRL